MKTGIERRKKGPDIQRDEKHFVAKNSKAGWGERRAFSMGGEKGVEKG